MSTKRRKRHTSEQIVEKLRDADAMLNSCQELAVVVQTSEMSESTYERWRRQLGGMKSKEAGRLKESEDENKRLMQIVAKQQLDIRMLKQANEGDWSALLESESSCCNFRRSLNACSQLEG